MYPLSLLRFLPRMLGLTFTVEFYHALMEKAMIKQRKVCFLKDLCYSIKKASCNDLIGG